MAITVLFLTVAVTAYYGTIQATGLDFVDWPAGSKIVSTFGKGDACVAPTIVMMPWIWLGIIAHSSRPTFGK